MPISLLSARLCNQEQAAHKRACSQPAPGRTAHAQAVHKALVPADTHSAQAVHKHLRDDRHQQRASSVQALLPSLLVHCLSLACASRREQGTSHAQAACAFVHVQRARRKPARESPHKTRSERFSPLCAQAPAAYKYHSSPLQAPYMQRASNAQPNACPLCASLVHHLCTARAARHELTLRCLAQVRYKPALVPLITSKMQASSPVHCVTSQAQACAGKRKLVPGNTSACDHCHRPVKVFTILCGLCEKSH